MTGAAPPMPDLDEADVERLVDALAPALGLAVDPAWRGAVVANLKTVAAAARLVHDASLADELEPAPVFRA